MKKWFVTDMDGTFLNDKKQIPPNSKEIIKKLQEKGIKFFIATGRLDLAVKNYYRDMGLNEVIISCNGGFIRNQITGKVIYSKEFSLEEIEYIYEIYKKLTDNSVDFHIYTANYIYCDRLSFNLSRIKKVEEKEPEEYKTPMYIDENIMELIKSNKEKCFKVMIASKNHKLLVDIYEKVCEKFKVSGTFSASNFFDIMPYGVNKGEGIKRVAEYYGIDVQNSVVFGDNLNDIDMLKVAGHSVCPSNAKDEIKKMCDEIIGSNNEFSVIKYINDYLKSL